MRASDQSGSISSAVGASVVPRGRGELNPANGLDPAAGLDAADGPDPAEGGYLMAGGPSSGSGPGASAADSGISASDPASSAAGPAISAAAAGFRPVRSRPSEHQPGGPAIPPLEVMVVGSGPAAPQPDSPGSGLLLRSGGEALLIDCGPGTIGRLRRFLDPCTMCGVVITHFHADHYLDLIALRYLLPWAGTQIGRLNVYLPPGGEARLETLAEVIDERPSFFADAFDICEYDPDAELVTGPFRLRFVASRHYVPAWGVDVSDPAGRRVFYTGDTGPNPDLAAAARGAALLVIEATLGRAEEDVTERGHLSLDEAIEVGKAAGVPRMILTHFPAERRAQIRARSNGSRPQLYAARPGLRLRVGSVAVDDREHGQDPIG